jgi:3-oxoacyl-[acyl-carrier protein] reductase
MALAVQADMTQLADIEKLFAETVERHGWLDILVNNAGGMHLSQLLDLPDEAWQENIDVTSLAYCAARGWPCRICGSRNGD